MRSLLVTAAAFAAASVLWIVFCAPNAHSQRRKQVKARGHDHLRHQLEAAKAGTETTCQSCHTVAALTVSARPDHQWCFGTCHVSPPPATKSGTPYLVPLAQRRLCETCHRGADLDNAARGTPLPKLPTSFAGRAEFSAELSHATHSGESCRSCHQKDLTDRPSRTASDSTGNQKPGAVHRRCIRCHQTKTKSGAGKAIFAINECERCHRGSRPGARSAFSVLHFSHLTHAPRVTQSKDEGCQACHRGAKSEPSRQVASPTKAQCFGCHDGKKAFSMTTNECRRCHAAAREQGAAVRVEPVLLRHQSHMALACDACHDTDGSFAADRGHAMCSNQNCHPNELERVSLRFARVVMLVTSHGCHSTSIVRDELTVTLDPLSTTGCTLREPKTARTEKRESARVVTPRIRAARMLESIHRSTQAAMAQAVTPGGHAK